MTGGVSYWVTTTNLFVADNWRYSIVTNNLWEKIEDTPVLMLEIIPLLYRIDIY